MSVRAFIGSDQFRRLHPRTIDEPDRIRGLLEEAQFDGASFRQGMNRKIEPELATLEEIGDSQLQFRVRNFDRASVRQQVFLKFEVGGSRYFFAASVQHLEADVLVTAWPSALYCEERRDRTRQSPSPTSELPTRVVLDRREGSRHEASVLDHSPDGLGVLVRSKWKEGESLSVRVIDGSRAGETFEARVSYAARDSQRPEWTRLGLYRATAGVGTLSIESADRLVPSAQWRQLAAGISVASQSARLAAGRAIRRVSRREPSRASVEVVRYHNDSSEEIVGILDRSGDGLRPIAVLIPPAWGRTKETLLPLALTIVATFKKADLPVVVLRFDGTRRRGESYKPPEFRKPGYENRGFTFFGGTNDIQASVAFLEQQVDPSTTILVTFSAASLEGRKAIALDSRGRIGGWISVVGSADLQSMMRVISGGIDYVGGVERGVDFGLQEVLGVEVDIDLAGRDAIQHGMAYLEDAKKDLAGVTIPITWYHGRYDAWMDLGRVREALSSGDRSRRRLVLIPTGHQLRSSREALDAFQAIAMEVARIATGQTVVPAVPPIGELSARQGAERSRLPAAPYNPKKFWHDYLVGVGENLGIELMTATAPYRQLMHHQVDLLEMHEGLTIVDLGSGVGAFGECIAKAMEQSVSVIAIDLVHDALLRGQQKAMALSDGHISQHAVEADLEVSIPLGTCVADRVIASLLLSYLSTPRDALDEMFRLLRPGGRLVLSALRKDADISKIFTEGLVELKAQGTIAGEALRASARTFLNDASRLLDLEERGEFCFWDESELRSLVLDAGFVQPAISESFGSPPQALVVTALRPVEHLDSDTQG